MESLYFVLQISVVVAVVIGFIIRLLKNLGVSFDAIFDISSIGLGILNIALLLLFVLFAGYAIFDMVIAN